MPLHKTCSWKCAQPRVAKEQRGPQNEQRVVVQPVGFLYRFTLDPSTAKQNYQRNVEIHFARET